LTLGGGGVIFRYAYMPRLTTSDYLFCYQYLHEIWVTDYSPFGLITTKDQRYLHDYFPLSKEMTDAELLTHQADVAARRPSLPHSAGRALKHLANPDPLRVASATDGNRRIVVYPIARPEIDTKRMAEALLDYIKSQTST
jgi:hypothetical protein